MSHIPSSCCPLTRSPSCHMCYPLTGELCTEFEQELPEKAVKGSWSEHKSNTGQSPYKSPLKLSETYHYFLKPFAFCSPVQ
jgi:hypothetical protein